MLCYRDKVFCPFWGECLKGADCERALTMDIETAAIETKLPICRESVNPDCFVDGTAEVTAAMGGEPVPEPEPTLTLGEPDIGAAEEWDKTTEDCRNCTEFEPCWAIDPEKARGMIAGDDDYEDNWPDCCDDDCFEPIDDD